MYEPPVSSGTAPTPNFTDLINQMNQLNQTFSSMIMDSLGQMLTSRQSPAPTPQPGPHRHHHHEYEDEECHHHHHEEEWHHHHHETECRDCEWDDCYCRCCIGDADLVVYARLGERRVVPIVLENDRRREKTIHLEMSDFKTRGGDQLGVKSVLTPPVDFPLPPCGEHQTVLVVEVAGMEQRKETGATDVDECKVLYSDLRVEGCDMRPLRVALAILPRDCDTFDIHCGCSCC
jgi:hypothetical protein